MPTLTTDQLLDLTKSTLKDLGVGRFQQIAQHYQRLEVFARWFKKDKMQFSGGVGIQRNLMTDLPSSAKHVGHLEEDSVDLVDLMAQMNIPWRMATTNWMVIAQEAMMNKGKSFIFNVLQPRRLGAMIALAELLEARAWSAPTAADSKNPYGLPYWVVKNNTTGFNGGYPSDHTTIAGLNLTTYPTFKNYTVQYTDHTKADLIAKMRTMHRKVRFKSPFENPSYAKELSDNYRLYCNETSIGAWETLGEAQNENLGRDLAPMWAGDVSRNGGGNLMFRGHPIIWVPYLDADTTDPIYMINHETFYPVCLEGDYLRETTQKAPNQHNVVQTFVDLTYNYLCVDRRQNGVAAKNT